MGVTYFKITHQSFLFCKKNWWLYLFVWRHVREWSLWKWFSRKSTKCNIMSGLVRLQITAYVYKQIKAIIRNFLSSAERLNTIIINKVCSCIQELLHCTVVLFIQYVIRYCGASSVWIMLVGYIIRTIKYCCNYTVHTAMKVFTIEVILTGILQNSDVHSLNH